MDHRALHVFGPQSTLRVQPTEHRALGVSDEQAEAL